MSYALRIDLERPFDEAVAMIKESLAESGFGILTEIDLKKTLKNKIDVDIEDQVILGACNPRFAYRGIQVEPSLGLLLPCNVVVRHSAGVTVVETIDPETMVTLTGNPEMEAVALEVRAGLKAALERVAAS
ncbi:MULTISPECIES: DUF302 domain-containing protein [unclassified Tessaracoccus]|uniref:DUF302 domain-containing protein n=1 Tax=unclassified Tessaracoccus TaxID=2635419 RepID=UPI001602E4CE|nr:MULTISPECIES: DUF302 domain-containing protein [unclassified Tessaracoccus]MBB1513389.1 DUF302 domain-containing protein [Tessaracoccus sp. MC1627]MBB1515359.1 DUF302 domain-containing protein [Tessaracoccus sp. MC1679]